ncbi:hypothetical protein GC176_08010 [bacterium]|nr:hypothetical protein [bacterium]
MKWSLLSALLASLLVTGVSRADDLWGLKKGTPEIQSAGVLAFGPDGILLIGDAKSATVFAVATGEKKSDANKASINVTDLAGHIAKTLHIAADDVQINDLAVNPKSGSVYVSVSKGGNHPAIVRIGSDGAIHNVSLTNVEFSKASLPDAPEDKVVNNGRRSSNPRMQSITDIAYVDGRVIVSGLASGQSPSSIREVAFPFVEADAGSRVEIYHGAHGKYEDYAAIRTFVPFNINGKPNLLAGYVCTPLVKFPLDSLKSGEKTRGTTVAELGNRNQPLDMIVYEKDGANFLLLANSARGVMKVSTQNIATNAGITSRVEGGGVAGQTYETIAALDGTVQLDKLNDSHAVVLIQKEGGAADLKTVDLP